MVKKASTDLRFKKLCAKLLAFSLCLGLQHLIENENFDGLIFYLKLQINIHECDCCIFLFFSTSIHVSKIIFLLQSYVCDLSFAHKVVDNVVRLRIYDWADANWWSRDKNDQRPCYLESLEFMERMNQIALFSCYKSKIYGIWWSTNMQIIDMNLHK